MSQPSVSKICECCHQPFLARPSDIKRGYGKYCSRKCRGQACRTKVEKTCPICQSPFFVHIAYLRRSGGKYCSPQCYHEARRSPAKDRFWEKVNIGNLEDCWEWQGARLSNQYGRIGIDSSHGEMTHRFAWMLTYGDIPDGLFVLHHCDNPPCVNPRHLFLGTHQDNMDDMVRKGRQSRGSQYNKR